MKKRACRAGNAFGRTLAASQPAELVYQKNHVLRKWGGWGVDGGFALLRNLLFDFS